MATEFIPITYTQIFVTAIIAVIVIIGDKMWKILPAEDETAYSAKHRSLELERVP